MTPETLLRFDRRVPRYTSYPTAADFTADVGPAQYHRWLSQIPRNENLSLYVHIPFCTSLCWFCGCHTTVVRRYGPIASYLELVGREVEMLSAVLGDRRRVVHMHWGGGTPTALRPDDIQSLARNLRTRFRFAADAEFAVEVDPRSVDQATIAALAEAGVTRVSLGVQDFNPDVQRAVNRVQPFDLTKKVVGWLRDAGIDALNIDLLYGLPGQTVEGLMDTVDKTIALAPGRVAVYGYAHVPWMKRHQRLIDESRLPDARGRLALATAVADRFAERGYLAVGLDHFVLPTDPMAVAVREGRLRRNFQGYTTEPAETLLGLGTSAIGTLRQGYVQNASQTRDYRAAIEAGEFSVMRGVAIDADDRMRRSVIERLMCFMEVDLDQACRDAGADPAALFGDLQALAPLEECGAVRVDGHRVRVMPDARMLLRVACAAFDRRLAPAAQRHSAAV